MKAAIQEAVKAQESGEIPIGAVIVYKNIIIASGYNMKEEKKNVSCHAEMIAIQKAEKVLNKTYLDECDMYVTLEPCMMCTGAISLARIRRLYYGTASNKSGSVHTLIQMKGIPYIGTYPREIYADIMHDECTSLLKNFFQSKRKKNQV